MSKQPILAGLLFLALVPISARDGAWELGVDLAGAFPRGEFEDFADDGIGIGFRFARALGNSPWYAGFDFRAITYGDRTFFPGSFDQGFFDLEKIRVENDILAAHVMLKWQRRRGIFRPFIEGLLGIKHLETQTTLFFDDSYDGTETDTDFDDTGLSWGTGIGLDVTLRDGYHKGGSTILLHTACRWLNGSRTEHVIEDSVFFDGQDLFFEVVETETDLLSIDVGVSFRF